MATKFVSKSRFKAKALELFREVESSGQPIVVTDNGRPSIEVRRYQPAEVDPFQALRGTVHHYEAPFEPIGLEDWESLN